ncbi:MAG: acylphosphatase [Bacteroidales bacterium]|nr:acylphosphatase [Bacteroidales bacterium]HOK98855.1 acylphosphatase [Bacteroidales bacterium]HPO65675.1 acylphosphatase [Bacteroidales bacterium]
MKKHYNLIVHGRVQGVGFRYHARARAFHLGIQGIIRNLDDGSVYIEAEGDPDSLQAFIDWCKEGPPHAQVTHVEVTAGALKNYDTFEIVR